MRLVLELIVDCCSQQNVGRDSIHYGFKLLIQHFLEIFILKENDKYTLNTRGDLTDLVLYPARKNDCFLNYDINKH